MGRRRGQPQLYEEPKTAHIFADITPTAKRQLDEKIYRLDARLSRGEFFERLGRGENLDIVEFNRVFFGISILIES